MDEPAADHEAHLRETPVASERVWHGAFLDVRRDRVRMPDGRLEDDIAMGLLLTPA